MRKSLFPSTLLVLSRAFQKILALTQQSNYVCGLDWIKIRRWLNRKPTISPYWDHEVIVANRKHYSRGPIFGKSYDELTKNL